MPVLRLWLLLLRRLAEEKWQVSLQLSRMPPSSSRATAAATSTTRAGAAAAASMLVSSSNSCSFVFLVLLLLLLLFRCYIVGYCNGDLTTLLPRDRHGIRRFIVTESLLDVVVAAAAAAAFSVVVDVVFVVILESNFAHARPLKSSGFSACCLGQAAHLLP